MLRLSRNAEQINAVVNHPAVRPFVGPVELGELNLSHAVMREENFFLFGEFGGFSLGWTSPYTREVHTFILPEGRGEWARKVAREAINYAFDNGTDRLWSRIPPDRDNVRAYAEEMGMQPTGEQIDTFGQPYDIYEMVALPCL